MSTVALNFVGGIPFQLLYDGIKIAIRRTSKFRSNLINLQFTLDCLQSRIIEQIGENNVELNLPNNIIEGIQTKMNEGVALVAMLSELGAWNIRIWANCYNCIGPNCADQLDELDRSLRSLLDQLELEQRRNVTRLMILAINARDKQDELEKRQLDILKGQQQILGMLMEQHHAIGKIASSRVQVASSTGGGGGTAPALGLVFRLLFDAVTQVRVKNEMVKRLLRRFKSTLNYLHPLIEEVAKSKRVLHLSDQEVEMFISEVENGVELIHKCSKVSKRVNYKKYKYTNKILDLDKSLQRLFFELKGQVERNLKEAMDSAITIEAVIKKIEGGADQQKCELKSESQRSVPQPGSFTIGLHILNEQGHRDMNKDTQVDSTRNVEVVRPIEKSGAVEHQMETKSSCEVPPSPAGGLDVLNLQGSLDMDSTTSIIEAGVMDMEGIEVDDLKTNVHVKGTLEFAINVEKMGLMGVKKIEGGGGSQDIKIAVAETEPLSPAAQLDVQDEVHGTRDAKVTLEIRKNVKDAITTAAEPSSPSAEVGVKLDSSAFPSSSPLCTQAELKLPDKEKVIEEVVSCVSRNVKVVRPIEGSDAVQNQMETKSSCEVIPSPAGGLDVLNLQGPIDMEGIEADDLERKVQETMGAYVKGTLDFEINVEKMGLMGVKKIEGGDQDIEIAVAETEPLSPAAQLDVLEEVHGTRDEKVTLEIPYVIEAITTAEPSSSSAEVGMKLDSSAFPSSSPSCTRAELKLPEKEKVIEEVVQVLRPSSSFLKIGSSLGIQALEPSSLSLVFTKGLFLPIFTETKISDEDNNQIQILVVGKNMIRGSHQMAPISLPHLVKLEIVVLNGEFGDRENWTRQEFDSKVVKERNGKRPLLTGDLSVTLRDGFSTIGDIKFTDNSSWIRGRKFRIGARVAPGYQGPRIREAMTDAFVVKDGPGLARAAYNKHYPPMLEDEVWRLEKIGKYGAFHKRLAAENIHTVEDFLKMSVVDPVKLKNILGFGMSERMWEATLKHARTCEMGNKMYVRKAHAYWSSLEAADTLLFPINAVDTMLNEAALIRQDHRDMMNKETQVDSARIVKVVKPAIAGTDAVQDQMETTSSCEVPPSSAGGIVDSPDCMH